MRRGSRGKRKGRERKGRTKEAERNRGTSRERATYEERKASVGWGAEDGRNITKRHKPPKVM